MQTKLESGAEDVRGRDADMCAVDVDVEVLGESKMKWRWRWRGGLGVQGASIG